MGKSLEGIGRQKMEISYNPIGNWNNNIGTYLQREGFIFLSTSCKRFFRLDSWVTYKSALNVGSIGTPKSVATPRSIDTVRSVQTQGIESITLISFR